MTGRIGANVSTVESLAALAFEDPICLVLPGVHAYRKFTNGEEIIRIISARKAETSDIRRYQEQAVD